MQFGLLPTCYCEAVSETYSNLIIIIISKTKLQVMLMLLLQKAALWLWAFKATELALFGFLVKVTLFFFAFLQNLLNRFQRNVLLPIETSLLFEWLCVSFPSRFHFQRSIFPGKMGLLVDLKAQDIYSNTSSRGLFHFT